MLGCDSNNPIHTWTSHIVIQRRELEFTTLVSQTSFGDIPDETKEQISQYFIFI